MANARKCDRCGAFYTDNKVKSIDGKYITRIGLLNDAIIVKRFDFCDECLNEFDKFMNEPNAMDIVNEYIKNHYRVKTDNGLIIANYTTPKIKCVDGFEISVQANESAYCQPTQNSAWPYKMVELGYPSERDDLIIDYAKNADIPTRTIYPYVPVDLVVSLIEKHGGIRE